MGNPFVYHQVFIALPFTTIDTIKVFTIKTDATEFIKGEGFKLYVENFHLSVLYDSGPLIFSMWMVFNIAVIYENIIKRGRMPIAIIIFGFVLINLFSSNLTNYTTQVIYWSVIFQIITWNNKKSNKVNIIGEYHE